jgi:glutamine cyclotransferase
MPTYNDTLNVMYTVTAAELEELEQTALSYQYNAEAWAVGKRNDVDVATTDPTYHNNSKWYSQQAGNSATSAREDAELAGQYAEAAATATLTIYPRPFEDLLASNGEALLASDGGHIYADALSINDSSVAIQHLQEKELLQDQNITSARVYAKSLYDANHDFAQGLYDAGVALMEAGDADLQSQIDATNNLFSKRHAVLLASDGSPLQTSNGEDLLIDILSWMEFSVAVQRLQEAIASLTDRVKACEMHISSVLKRLQVLETPDET